MNGLLAFGLVFLLMLFLFLALDRATTRAILTFFYLLTNSERAAYYLYALVLLPGTLLHETSHWFMAKLMRVPTSGFSLIPRFENGQLVMGHVLVRKSDPIRSALVGLAPLFVGTVVVVTIATRIFGMTWPFLFFEETITWRDMLALFWQEVHRIQSVPDAPLWFYILFSVSNAMVPSESDRVEWRRAFFWVALFTFLLIFGLRGPNVPAFLLWLLVSLGWYLIFAFSITILVDVPILLLFNIGILIVGGLRGRFSFS
ncbi:hypothetical protein ARMA_1085 [Ardenticatena maritima]|uniref:Uncharacterized protein n=1 Tax=Ardenticatena maritima TaxID=872965 RepID=A0A0M8K826_9CHLR|nr:hypothetical protein [Ardenticatena maritima]KPL87079.1 hypothetical protein SE16_10980 [Ardenticatena maritima]GAP62662.1 hypothetical protein ARMA_1085 [Ardenticatena maritima]